MEEKKNPPPENPPKPYPQGGDPTKMMLDGEEGNSFVDEEPHRNYGAIE